jgi:hypothetical protein
LEKQVLAWWLRKKTVVSRRWISEKLGMGDLSRVSNAVRNVDSGKDSEMRRWKTKLCRGRGTPLNNSVDMRREWVIRKEVCRD